MPSPGTCEKCGLGLIIVVLPSNVVPELVRIFVQKWAMPEVMDAEYQLPVGCLGLFAPFSASLLVDGLGIPKRDVGHTKRSPHLRAGGPHSASGEREAGLGGPSCECIMSRRGECWKLGSPPTPHRPPFPPTLGIYLFVWSL